MKTLEDYVMIQVGSKESMAKRYSIDNTLGFCIKYMICFKPTLHCIWDPIKH